MAFAPTGRLGCSSSPSTPSRSPRNRLADGRFSPAPDPGLLREAFERVRREEPWLRAGG